MALQIENRHTDCFGFKRMDKGGELWIPRTPWEKRRQLSAFIRRSMSMGRRMLMLSCDDWTTFFGRLDIAVEQVDEALLSGQLEYLQLNSAIMTNDGKAPDFSRVFGEIGLLSPRSGHGPELVVVDDVDLIVDLAGGGHESVSASLFTLVYALRSRFREIVLFANPPHTDEQRRSLEQLAEHLVIHSLAPAA